MPVASAYGAWLIAARLSAICVWKGFAMLSRLIARVMPWALVIALVVGAGLIWRLSGLQDQLTEARQANASTQATLDVTAATLAVQVERNQLLVQALDERERELNDGAQRIESLRAQANALGADDAESKEYGDQPVPIGVTDWVRRLTTPAANDSGATVVPD
jgi:hypothetical protein